MKQFSTILLLLYCSISLGQFAIVNDKDNFLNVRADGIKDSKIIEKLQNGQLVYCFENKGNWTNIEYDKNGKYGSGYIFKDRYKLVSDFPAFSILNKSENTIALKMDTIEVSIFQSKFDKKKHKIKYAKDNPTFIELIDNKQYWGTDGEMPNTQFEKINIKIGKKSILLPKAAIEGLYQPSFHYIQINYDKPNGIIYIQTSNSDGAGAYLVVWKVENGIYKERLIAYGF